MAEDDVDVIDLIESSSSPNPTTLEFETEDVSNYSYVSYRTFIQFWMRVIYSYIMISFKKSF